MKVEYKTLSSITRKLLNGSEGATVDFKRQAKNINGEDMVAFANSKSGGCLLIGVDEYENDKGVQKGKVVGCDIGDDAISILNNKATDCLPPINIKIYKENLSSKKPILRVQIDSSRYKPHCTKKGIYKIRQDNRNRALFPDEMLNIFLNQESESFLTKFREASNETELKIERLNENLIQVTESFENNLDYLERELYTKFEDVSFNIENAYEKSDENASTLDELWKMVDKLYRGNSNSEVISEIEDIGHAVDAVLNHHSIQDPNFEKKINLLRDKLYLLKLNDRWSDAEKEKYISLNFPFVPKDHIDKINKEVDDCYQKLKEPEN